MVWPGLSGRPQTHQIPFSVGVWLKGELQWSHLCQTITKAQWSSCFNISGLGKGRIIIRVHSYISYVEENYYYSWYRDLPFHQFSPSCFIIPAHLSRARKPFLGTRAATRPSGATWVLFWSEVRDSACALIAMLKHIASNEQNGTILVSFVLCNLAFRHHCMWLLKQGHLKDKMWF